MSARRIKRPALDARVISGEQWHRDCADLDELIRPVVLRVTEHRGRTMVTIRPKTAQEIVEIKKRRGLPLNDEELVTRSGSIVDGAKPLLMEDLK